MTHVIVLSAVQYKYNYIHCWCAFIRCDLEAVYSKEKDIFPGRRVLMIFYFNLNGHIATLRTYLKFRNFYHAALAHFN